MEHLWPICLALLLALGTSSGFSGLKPNDNLYYTLEPPVPSEDLVRMRGCTEALSYKLYLAPNLESSSFNGSVEVVVRIHRTTPLILMNQGSRLRILDAKVFDGKNESVPIDKLKRDELSESVIFELGKELIVSDVVRVTLSFEGLMGNDSTGLYRSSYFDSDGKQKWFAATFMYPIYARQVFPSFDEPLKKATFQINIQTPKGYKSISNMPGKAYPLSNGDNLYVFEETPRMPTYLVAFAVSNFGFVENEFASTRVFARPNALDQTAYALELIPDAVQRIETLLDTKYQLPEKKALAVPDFKVGAMEDWGLVTFRESSLLYDADEYSAAQKQSLTMTIVHEFVHNMFGNLVTPRWWSYTWLSEGFAEYLQYKVADQLEPQWKIMDQFVVDVYQHALNLDSSQDAKSLTRPIVTRADVLTAGDGIVYAKGASILRAMEINFGTDVFYGALRDYLKEKAYGVAIPPDLWVAFEKQLRNNKDNKNFSVADVMETWTTQPGYPVVTVTVESDQIHLSQQRFLIGNQSSVSAESLWSIPISWTSSKETNPSVKPKLWLTEKSQSIKRVTQDDEWLLFNVNASGFYRVNYDTATWKKIFNVLDSHNFEIISEINRATIVDDLLNLGQAEMLDFKIIFEGLNYLHRETSYLPIRAALKGFNFLIQRLQGHEKFHEFKSFMVSLFSSIYERLSFDDELGDERLTVLLRSHLNNFMCSINEPNCVKNAKDHFYYFKSFGKPIPVNQKSVVYCTAVREGSEENWNYLSAKYKVSNVEVEKIRILSALGCSKDLDKLEEYFLRALSSFEESRIYQNHLSYVFQNVYSSPKSAEFLIDFAAKNYKLFFQKFNSYTEMAQYVSQALTMYPTKSMLSKVKNLLSNPELSSIKKYLNKAVAKAEFEQEWVKRNLPQLLSANMILPNVEAIQSKDSNLVKFEDTEAYRLPKNVQPKEYTIHLVPFLIPDNFTFNGRVNILARLQKADDKIVLHSHKIDIKKLTVYDIKNGHSEIPYSHYNMTGKYNFLTIYFDTLLSEGTEVEIVISYVGYLDSDMRGFYRSSYKHGKETRWLAATHLEPVGARRVFPCFDEPSFKAVFKISVEVPPKYTAVSNMDVKFSNETYYEFEETPIMSTYLIAVIVSDFSKKASADGKYAVWSSPVVADQLDYSLAQMEPVVQFFESHLKVNYALPKMDMFALPDFSAGAMENWGLITYREAMMLYHPNLTNIVSQQHIRNVIAHEYAHQWFGDLVTCDWWDYLFLNEGFARYFQYHAHSPAEDSWDLESLFVPEQVHLAFVKDASRSTRPVVNKVYSPKEISSMFDSITYGKGASILRMLEKIIGHENFYKGLHRYMVARKYNTGLPQHLFQSIQEAVDASGFQFNQTVSDFMSNWTMQSGYPVVHVHFDGNNAYISQRKYFTRPLKSSPLDSPWLIPLTYTTQSNPDFNATSQVVWMNNRKKAIQLANTKTDWVVFNLQQAGFYRVNYDNMMWRRIIKFLKSENYQVIHRNNRAMLVDDLFNLGRAGYLDYSIVISGVDYLRNETSYIPWASATAGFSYLKQRFLGHPEVYDSFKEFVIDLMEPSFKRLGFYDKANESPLDKNLRRQVVNWLCKLDHEDCVKYANESFSNYIKTNEWVPVNERSFIYCTVVRNGPEDYWNFLFNKLHETDYSAERLAIMAGLACTQNQENLHKLMEMATTAGTVIRLQDSQSVFSNIVSSGLFGIEAALDFVIKNFETMQKYYAPEETLTNILKTISKNLSTEKLMNKFKTFVNSKQESSTLAKNLRSLMKRVVFEDRWYNKYGANILKNMDKHLKPNYRLPEVARPSSYQLFMKPYFEEKNFTFDGKVIIDVHVEKLTWKIVVNSKDLSIRRVVVLNRHYDVDSHVYNATTEMLSIYFRRLLQPGDNFKLKLLFKGNLTDVMQGFYKSYYIDESGNKRWLATTHFQASHAREAFPCFDEPAYKAIFHIHVSRPANYHTRSNTELVKSTPEDSKERVWDEFAPTPMMSSYLVAFVISDFKSLDRKDYNVKVWSRPAVVKDLAYAADLAPKVLQFFEKLLDVPYTLNKMDAFAIPDFEAGAMENWGAVTYREYGLIYNENYTSESYKRYIAEVVAHEFAHQWFGDLVTCDWWQYIWLNEGFAQFMEYTAVNYTEPTWRIFDQFPVAENQIAMIVDGLESTHEITKKRETPADLLGAFDSITYAKGASVNRMMRHAFGDHIFFKALHEYLVAHQFNTSKPEYLASALDSRLNKEDKKPGGLQVTAQDVLYSWINNPGYPVVNVTVKNGVVDFVQERFYLNGSTTANRHNVTYFIPITYTTGSERDFESSEPKFWLGKEPAQIKLNSQDDWIVVNVRQYGFYRVNYDLASWEKLINVLNSDQFSQIHEVNRANLVNDLFNLARSAYVDYELPLAASKYYTRETSYIGWKGLFNAFDYIAPRIEKHPEVKEAFAKYLRSLIPNAFESLNFESYEAGDHLQRLNRILISSWACKYGYKKCVDSAVKMFADWRDKQIDFIEPNAAGAAYCSGIEHGNSDDWEFMWQKFVENNYATDQIYMMKALGCTKNVTLINKYLDYAYTEAGVRRQDLDTAVSGIYSYSSVGVQAVYDYYKTHLDVLYKYFKNKWGSVGSQFESLSVYMSTEEDLKEIQTFKKKDGLPAEVVSSLEKMAESIEKNLKWIDDFMPKVFAWFQKNSD